MCARRTRGASTVETWTRRREAYRASCNGDAQPFPGIHAGRHRVPYAERDTACARAWTDTNGDPQFRTAGTSRARRARVDASTLPDPIELPPRKRRSLLKRPWFWPMIGL